GRNGVRYILCAVSLLALLAARCGADEARAPRRLGLIIGINRYANAGSALRGCGNDAALTERLLEERGYAPILTLKDTQATEGGIRAALKSLTAATGPGDY